MKLGLRWKEFRTSLDPMLKELRFILSRIKKSPLSIVGLVIVVFFVFLAILAPVLAPPMPGYDPYMMPREKPYGPIPQPPSEKHPFGTTPGQYDIYYGCIWGTRTAFRIGVLVVAISLLIGVVIGGFSGYYGGVVDEIMMRVTDVIFAFPGLLLSIALVLSLPAVITLDLGLFKWDIPLTTLDKVLISFVLIGWPGYARVIRGEVMRVKNEDFIEAARAVGCSNLRIMTRHIFPNAIYPIIIMASLDIGGIVLSAAALGFLGIGSPEGYSDWGRLIALSRDWIYSTPQNPFEYWYLFIIPGLFIFFFVLGWNLLGDAFRDILDPTLRRR
ncbi:MAG: ABC transporter permease [Candidatus Bathyarchaeia archaeon]